MDKTPSEAPKPEVPHTEEAPSNAKIDPSAKKMQTIIFAIVGVLVLAIIGVSVSGIFNNKDTDAKDTTQNSSRSDNSSDKKRDTRSANATTAKYLNDFDALCSNGSITNAASVSGDSKYIITSFYEGNRDGRWTQSTAPYDATYAPDRDKITDVTHVVCLDRKDGREVKSDVCTFKSGGEEVKIDYFATEYKATVYEAKTGKTVGTLADINGPALKCPMFVTYDKNNPKLFGKPDEEALNQAILDYIK